MSGRRRKRKACLSSLPSIFHCWCSTMAPESSSRSTATVRPANPVASTSAWIVTGASSKAVWLTETPAREMSLGGRPSPITTGYTGGRPACRGCPLRDPWRSRRSAGGFPPAAFPGTARPGSAGPSPAPWPCRQTPDRRNPSSGAALNRTGTGEPGNRSIAQPASRLTSSSRPL